MTRPEGYKQLRDQLIKHEGLRLKPYTDSVGKITIGVGRNLDDVGISQLEAMQMLLNDIDRVVAEAQKFSWYSNIGVVRQDVILNMLFNLGLTRFNQFKNFIKALTEQNYNKAADEMLASRWAQQVGIRAQELSKQMRTGNRV